MGVAQSGWVNNHPKCSILSLLKFSFISSWDCINPFLLPPSIPPFSFSHHLFFIRAVWAAGDIPAGSGCGALMQVTSITHHSHSHTLQFLKNISFPSFAASFCVGLCFTKLLPACPSVCCFINLSEVLIYSWAAAVLIALSQSSSLKLFSFSTFSLSDSRYLSLIHCPADLPTFPQPAVLRLLTSCFYLSAESDSLSGASPVLSASTVMV